MPFINHLSMRGKLAVLLLPALLMLLYFAAASITDSYRDFRDIRSLQELARLAAAGDPLIESLQRERGRTAVYLASGRANDARNTLTAQRQQTDSQIDQYRKRVSALLNNTSMDQGLRASASAVDRALGELPSLRKSIDGGQVDSKQAMARYTGTVRELLDRITLIVRRASEPELVRQINAYYALAEAAERGGLERAAGAALIRRGEFSLPGLQRIAALAGAQKADMDIALAMLSRENQQRQSLERLVSTSYSLSGLREILFSSESGLNSLKATDWFDQATARLGDLNQTRTTLLSGVLALTETLAADEQRGLIVTATVAALAVVLVIVLALIIMSSINRQVSGLLTTVQEAMDNKDLSRQIPVTSNDELGRIGLAINQLFDRFGQALRQIDRSSVQLATATEETSSTANQNAAQVRSQQQQIEQVAAASEEMSATSEEISGNTQQVAGAARSATEKSRSGEHVLHSSVSRIRELATSVQQVNDVITELEEKSGTISEVVDVIRKVADQTNLLALNAAIEAARAGEHGRGFAVVADEVRSLARQTHDSTTEIESIVNGFREITGQASRSIITSHKLARETSDQTSELEQTFADILSDVGSISDMATQIAAASEQQVATTRELAGNMESVSEAAILTLTGSQEITQVTTEQARLARALQDLANEFRVAS
ncbi:Methyl-accepting chemotaxis protein [Marinobacter daqiaonensis]|uniref:Methyl-accepting chemotaxis protein n=1 Tax=Marinobacter daqiaonensis TaxID=650891 RepID=A0A1I6HQA8_9GAMM|nr:methyl-accepting chemotaxis protein [Marinobacter daqiaonensis]SFR56629.1 Methyl-accepting chemotaxis protein [Marinobacter daqiaonensis]